MFSVVPSNGEVMRKRRQEEADLAEFHQQKKAKEDFKQRRAEYMRE